MLWHYVTSGTVWDEPLWYVQVRNLCILLGFVATLSQNRLYVHFKYEALCNFILKYYCCIFIFKIWGTCASFFAYWLWTNLLNYEHRKWLTMKESPSATIMAMTRVGATSIQSWMGTKKDTSPSLLGRTSHFKRYTMSAASSYLSMLHLVFVLTCTFL